MSAPAWAVALEASGAGVFLRDSMVAYPLANLAHILGLMLLVGPIIALDLRLLGVARRISALDLSRLLTPFALIGLLLLITSGGALFTADASALAGHPVFQIKLALAAAGLVNAVVFRLLWSTRLTTWDRAAPAVARLQNLLSVISWLGAAMAGRLIAYF